jgi:hypothetical protein
MADSLVVQPDTGRPAGDLAGEAEALIAVAPVKG